ncbi:MAG: ABC transporter ATP-binding protein/permease [Treponemataceae bacterium]|nr:ABC transporter ATP-binding protein/permease [Treponemataceae bacterium]
MMIDKRLINLVPKSKKYVALTVFLKWLALLSNALLIFSIAHILKICKSGEFALSSITLPLILAALSIVITFLTSQFSSITSFASSKEVKKTLRSKVYEKLLRLGPEYQEKTETAKIIQWAVEGVEQIEVWFGQYLPQFFYSMIAALTIFAILAFLNWQMALVLLACVPLIPMSIVAVQKIAKKILKKYLDQYALLADNYLENLQGLTTLQIYKSDEDRQKKIGIEAENFRKITMKVLSFQLNSIIIMDTVAYAGAALGIALAIASYFKGGLSLENCFICILLSADFFIPLRRLGSFFHTAMNGTTASKNIFELLDTPEKEKGSQEITEIEGQPLFETSALSYNFAERQVLHDIDLKIEKGSFTAFVGKSGSGKSTTAKVLAGINCDYKGQAKVFGKELKEINPESLYKFCSYISHKDWIFKGSVRDCLLEGKCDATESQMWQVLEQVKLDAFLKEENGLDTLINENASNLSGGQKQRLSIARALLHDSEVYIFDEASSNIDVESEKAILDLLHSLKGKKTIIMISHRKENCMGADRIYNFEGGKMELVK